MCNGKPRSIEEWRNLPWLLRRKDVLMITGWDERELDKYVKSGVVRRISHGRKGHYALVQIARLCEVKL